MQQRKLSNVDKLENRQEVRFQGNQITFPVSMSTSYSLHWKGKEKIKEIPIPENVNLSLLEIGDPEGIVIYHLEKNAHLELNVASLEEAHSFHRHFVLKENSSVRVAYADFTFGKAKAEFSFDLVQENTEIKFHLATLAAEDDEKEFSVSFSHQAKNTYAEMQNYGVCEGKSKLVFSGVGHILHGAYQSKTHQNARIMVFDPHCEAHARPILKIDENDIEASHAASVGKVNEEHLFYLMSRGLTAEEGKQLITLGYLKPILGYFSEQTITEKLMECMERRMK